jgi:hypothetical protein
MEIQTALLSINRMGQAYIPTTGNTAMKMNKSHTIWPTRISSQLKELNTNATHGMIPFGEILEKAKL